MFKEMRKNDVNSELLKEEVRGILSTAKDPEREALDPSVLREEFLLREGIHSEDYQVPLNGHRYISRIHLNGTGGYSLWVETEVCVPEPEDLRWGWRMESDDIHVLPLTA